MKRIIALILTCCSGCLILALSTGCIVPVTSADKLFGDAARAPKILVEKKTPLWGMFGSARAEAGGEFAGDIDAKYDPASGGFHIVGKVSNNPTPVIGANAELIKAMEPTRLADFQRAIEQQKAVNEQVLALADVAKTLGSAGVSAFLAKSTATFPGTGGLPPGIDLPTIVNALGLIPGTPVVTPP